MIGWYLDGRGRLNYLSIIILPGTQCFRQRRCRSAALGTGKTLALYNFNVESCFLQLFDVAVFTIALGMI